MSIRQFEQEIEKGLSSPAYLLHSTEDFLLYEALSTIRNREAGADTFNFDIFDCESPDSPLRIEAVVDLLNTLPFLSQRRTVVIRNVQKLSKKEMPKVEAYVASPSVTSLLIMLYLGGAPKFTHLPGLKGLKMISLNVQERDIPLWVKERGRRRGIEFTDRALDYLMSTVGTDLGTLSAEIEKFSLWNTTVIDADTVKGMVYAGVEYSAFDLIDALGKGDEGEVFRIFGHLMRSVEPQMVLGALNWQYGNLWSRSFESGGERARAKFTEVFKALHEADAALKTSHLYVLENLFFRLLRITPQRS